jgi:CubicO group peptidase (beta-lactamase class C family)
MLMRRIMLVIVMCLLVAGSAAVGIVAADWPFWQRVLRLAQLPDSGEWPESFYQPVARIEGAAAAGTSPSFFAPADPAAPGIDPPALEAAAAWAEKNNSVALLVLHRGRVEFERYWGGMTGETLFSGRAMSRSLLGMVYGFAVTEGRLSLDDKAEKFLPEWRGEKRGSITIRQLMQNVSGLEEVPLNVVNAPADASAPVRLWYLTRSFLGKNSRLSLGSDFGAVALSFELAFDPASRFSFSNANSQLLGVILERATGEAFERYVQQRLWQFVAADAGEFYMDRSTGMPAVYCCFRATPRDFLRIGSLLADDGRLEGRQVLPPGWVASMRETSRINPLYGLQVWSGRAAAGTREYTTDSGRGVPHGEPYDTDDVIWMEGGGGRTIWAIPSQQLVIVRLGRASPDWDASVLPNTILRGVRPAVPTQTPRDTSAASPAR